MARESTNGNVGRTVYLPPKVWEMLTDIAQRRTQHPAMRGSDARHGSVSAVIEAIVTWDAAKAVNAAEHKVKETEAKLEAVRQMQRSADAVRYKVETAVAGLHAELIKIRDLKL